MHSDIAVFDDENKPVGVVPTIAEALEKGFYRRIVRIFLFDENGRILLQRRSAQVRHPLLWDQTVGGHVDVGETYEVAAYRELREELGVQGILLTPVAKEVKETTVFSSIYVAEIYSGKALIPDKREVEQLEWYTLDALAQLISESPKSCTDGLLRIWKLYKDDILAKKNIHKRITIVNEQNEIVGFEKYIIAIEKGYLRRVASSFVMDTNGRHLLQKRSGYVGSPHLLDSAVGGHVDEGDTDEVTVYKELKEELGISQATAVLIDQNHYCSECFGSVYRIIVQPEVQITYDTQEVESVHWMSTEELDMAIKDTPERFTPFLIDKWQKLRDKILSS